MLYTIAKRYYKTFTMKGGGPMEKEKRQDIVVLDEGTNVEAMAGISFCCRGAFSPFR
jgi:hypothetical protein